MTEINNNLLVQRTEQKKERKIYCIRGARGYAGWMNGTIVPTIEEADLIVAPGGSDIDPRLYGRTQHHQFAWGSTRMENDGELEDLKKAIRLGKKIWGTCKGIQYGSALSGGLLVADVSHPYKHPIKTEDGKTLIVNSMHHQLCYPFNLPKDEYRIIGWSEGISNHYDDVDGTQMEVPVEPEILYFPKTNYLGTQFHP